MGLDADWARISVAAAGHTCGVRTCGSLWCWGNGNGGQLGQGNAFALAPASVP